MGVIATQVKKPCSMLTTGVFELVQQFYHATEIVT